jgi:hypothetical protein
MKQRQIRKGHYVTPKEYNGDVYYVLDAGHGFLELEEVVSGNTYDSGPPDSYKRCPKPKTFKQEHKALCQKHGMMVAGCCTQQTAAFTRFSRELKALLIKHGSDIYV